MQVVADRADPIKVRQTAGREKITVGTAAAMDPRELRHAHIARGPLPLRENGFLGGKTFFGRAIEAALEREFDPIAGIDAVGERLKTRQQRFAVGYFGDANVDLGFGEVRHDVGRGGAATDIPDIDHHVGHLRRNLCRIEQELGERKDCAAAVVGDFGGVSGAAVAGGDEAARSLARVDDVAVGAARLEDKTELMVARRGTEEVRGAMRTGFFVGREQDLPTDARGVWRGFEGLERGEDRDEAALHVRDTRAIERGGIEPAADLKRVVGFVNGVVVTAEKNLGRRGRPQSDAKRARAGRIETRRVGVDFLDGRGGKRVGKIGAQGVGHAGKTGGVAGAGVDIRPALKERAEFGGAGGKGGDRGWNWSHNQKLPANYANGREFGKPA